MDKRSLGQLLADSWGLISKNFLALASTVAVVYVPFCVFSFLLMFGSFAFQSKLDFLSPTRSVPVIIAFIILFAIFITFAFIALMLFTMAIIKQIQACDQKKALPVADAYQQSFPLFGAFCIVVLWVFVKVSLWALLFLLPGVVFALFYSFAQMTFLLENKKGVEALKESRDLIQPFFWEFVGKSLVAVIILFAASWVFHAILSLAFPSQAGLSRVATSSLESLVNGFLSVFPTTFGYFLYKDLKARKG